MLSVFIILSEFVYGSSSSVFSTNSLLWVEPDFSVHKAIRVLQETFMAPFYALDTEFVLKGEHYGWYFKEVQHFLYFIPFLTLVIFSGFWKKQENIPVVIYYLIAVVALHLLLNCFYNKTWFLYSQNYLCFMVILFAYLYSKTSKNRQISVLSLFLLVQVVLNFKMLYHFAVWLNKSVSVLLPDVFTKLLTTDAVIVCLLGVGICIVKVFFVSKGYVCKAEDNKNENF